MGGIQKQRITYHTVLTQKQCHSLMLNKKSVSMCLEFNTKAVSLPLKVNTKAASLPRKFTIKAVALTQYTVTGTATVQIDAREVLQNAAGGLNARGGPAPWEEGLDLKKSEIVFSF